MALHYTTINELPERVKHYLYSDQLADVNWEIFQAHNVPSDQRGKVLDVVSDVFLKKTSVAEFSGRLARALMKTDAEVGPLAAEFAMRVLYPARDFLGPITDIAHTWNVAAAIKTYATTGEHFSIPVVPREKQIAQMVRVRPRVLKKPQQKAAFEALVTAIVDAGDAQFDEQAIQKQLAEMGVDDPQALVEIKRVLGMANHMQKNTSQAPRQPQKKKTQLHEEQAVAHDVKQAAKHIAQTLGPAAGAHVPAEQEIREEINTQITEQVSGVDLAALDSIIVSRVKGVRNTRQLSEALTQAKDQNGETLSGDTVMSIVTIVEETLARAPKPSVSTPAPKAAPKKTTKKSPVEKHVVDSVFVKTVAKKHHKPQSKPASALKKLDTIHEDHLLQAATAAAQSKQTKTPPPSAARNTNTPTTGKRLTDVRRPAHTLTGPVQEIEQLRIIDFRRSSPDPETRVEKVISAINRIGQENYVDKIQAIFAWRRSEPYQLYEQMVIHALSSGKPLAEHISAQTKAHKPVLDAAEVEAVIAGNTRLEQW